MGKRRLRSRRGFMKRVASVAGAGFAAACGASLMASGGPRGQEPSQRPNVLFILVDDHVIEDMASGALMPHTRSLGREGLIFNRAYCATSVCAAARYNCLTGRYSSRCTKGTFLTPDTGSGPPDGRWGGLTREGQTWVHWNVRAPVTESNLAQLMKRAGYATGIVGKEGPQFLDRRQKPRPEDPHAAQQDLADELKRAGFDYAGAISPSNIKDGTHNPEWQVKCAFDFLEANKGRPFYLHFAPHLLHMPKPLRALKGDPREAYYGMTLEEVPDVQPSRESVLRRVKAAGLDEELAAATWLDDSIGAILGKLEELGIADNTLIFFMQDNAHSGGKASLYEGGVKVSPTFARWPDGIVNPGRETDALIENIDIPATFLDACGVRVPRDYHLDGVSLMLLLREEAESVRDSVYCELGYTRAVVTSRWKYIAFRVPPSRALTQEQEAIYRQKVRENPDAGYDPQLRVTQLHRQIGGCNTERTSALAHYRENFFDRDQLYDLKNDSEEKANLAGNLEYADVLRRMKQKLRVHLRQVPGTFAEFKKKMTFQRH